MARRPRSTLTAHLRIVGPRLRDLLADTSVPFARIAEILRDEHDVDVSRETLRRWAEDLELPPRGSADDGGEAA